MTPQQRYELNQRGGIETVEDLNTWTRDIERQIAELKDKRNAKEILADMYGQATDDFSNAGLYSGVKHEPSVENYRRMGEFAMALIRDDKQRIANMGGDVAGFKDEDPLSSNTKTALGTALVSDAVTGSITVPVDFLNEVVRGASQASDLMGKVRHVGMNSRTMSVPAYLTGAAFTKIAAQQTDTTESNPTFQSETLTSYTYALFIPVSMEVMQDNAVMLGEYIYNLVTEAYAVTFDTEMLTSSSAPVGLLNDTGVNSYTMSSSSIENLAFDDLQYMIQELTTNAKRKGANWFIHPTVTDILRLTQNAMGDYIFHDVSERGPAAIWGRPYIESDELPESGDDAASTAFMALGNPKYLIHGDRLGLSLKYFDQTMYMVQNLEAFFLAYVRAAFLISPADHFTVLSTSA